MISTFLYQNSRFNDIPWQRTFMGVKSTCFNHEIIKTQSTVTFSIFYTMLFFRQPFMTQAREIYTNSKSVWLKKNMELTHFLTTTNVMPVVEVINGAYLPTSSTTLSKIGEEFFFLIDIWHMTCKMWNMTCDMWQVVGDEHFLKAQLRSSYGLGVTV